MATNSVLPDAQHREAIATRLDTTLLVEAAAGTGKTTSLATRMVALLREGKAEAQHIAAITFTRKAAAHLRQKFQNELEKAHAAEPAGESKDRLASALEHIDQLYIGTIHSFCAQLIRERPVEAGVDPGFTELEESEDQSLRDTCWHEYANRLFVEESPLLQQLEDYGVELDRLQATYNILCYYPDVIPVVSKVPRPGFATTRQRMREFLGYADRQLPDQPHEDGWDELQSRLRRALRLQRVLDTERDTEFVRLLEAMDANGKATYKRWPDKDEAKEVEKRFAEFRQDVVAPALRRWREYLHPILIEAVTPAVEQFAEYRQDNAKLNFQDLLMIARDLLKDSPRIRSYFRQRFTHLLVDEFQDTDPIQAELILYLTGDDSQEMDWHKVRPVPGALFVVGDPKQSIYRFRRADISTYNRVREIIERSGGEVLTLSTNFRSVESICASVNATFDGIFPAESTEEQAGQVRLNCQKPDGPSIAGVYKLQHSTSGIKGALGVEKVNNKEKVQSDATSIARWIRGAIDTSFEILDGDGARKVEPGDFLVAVRRKKNLRAYTQALESLAIPFEIAGAGGFAESEEIGSLLPFLKCVVDPDDAICAVSYLRGRLCGTEDSALLEYKRAGGRFNYTADVPEGASPKIAEAFGLLREAREWSRRLPPAAALAKMCERLGLVPDAACREFGNTRAGNLMKMLTLARNLSIDGESFAGIVTKLEELCSSGDAEEMGIEPGRADAVRLMNLHKAKGLEAPIVFLADPTEGREHDPKYHVDRASDPPRGHFVFWMPQGDHHKKDIAVPLDWDSKAEVEKRFEAAEEDRLVYVGATRAMNILVVSVYYSESKRELQGPWTQLVDASTHDLPMLSPKPLASQPAQIDLSTRFSTAREEFARVFDAAMTPSYAVTNVTKITHDAGGGTVAHAEDGHGSGWGRVLHSTLEALMRNPELSVELLVENGLRQEEMPLDDAGEIVRLVESVRTSNVWKSACQAEKRFVEVPFALTVPSTDLGISDGPTEAVLSGVIDLAYWDGDSWVIIDYKSDVTANRLQSLIDLYAPQVRCYQRYWQQLTGKPSRSALYFVESGHVEWVGG